MSPTGGGEEAGRLRLLAFLSEYHYPEASKDDRYREEGSQEGSQLCDEPFGCNPEKTRIRSDDDETENGHRGQETLRSPEEIFEPRIHDSLLMLGRTILRQNHRFVSETLMEGIYECICRTKGVVLFGSGNFALTGITLLSSIYPLRTPADHILQLDPVSLSF